MLPRRMLVLLGCCVYLGFTTTTAFSTNRIQHRPTKGSAPGRPWINANTIVSLAKDDDLIPKKKMKAKKAKKKAKKGVKLSATKTAKVAKKKVAKKKKTKKTKADDAITASESDVPIEQAVEDLTKETAEDTATPAKEEVKEEETITASPEVPIIPVSALASPVVEKKEVVFPPRAERPDLDVLGDLSGGRPGAIVESEEELQRKQEILEEMESGTRAFPEWMSDYGVLAEDEVEYDIDDPDALDASQLGTWTIQDLKSKLDYEWDETEEDPNHYDATSGDYVTKNEVDEEGIEVGYDPIFGPSNPIDVRTKLGTRDSYMIDDETRDDTMLAPQFPEGDPEIEFNNDFVNLRRSMRVIETYTDPFLQVEVPQHVAKWYGYPQPMSYPKQNYTNNRFTEEKDMTNFDAMEPWMARQKAVEMARAQNSEWLPVGKSHEWHAKQRQPYEDVKTLVGTLRRGDIDEDLHQQIQPALDVLKSSVELLSIEQGTVYRFHYRGLMKNKHGMSCWTETLLRNCGVEVTGVVFETGFRKRDPIYDGGSSWDGPHN